MLLKGKNGLIPIKHIQQLLVNSLTQEEMLKTKSLEMTSLR
jgi:hypothetical protein